MAPLCEEECLPTKMQHDPGINQHVHLRTETHAIPVGEVPSRFGKVLCVVWQPLTATGKAATTVIFCCRGSTNCWLMSVQSFKLWFKSP